MIEMSVESVRINLATHQRVVILKALNEEQRYMLIWIANAEAYAIAVQLQGTVSPRPLTHDLMKSLIERMGAKVLRVVISDLRDEIFYANVVLELAGQEVEIDARPSDAIALAVRIPVPVFVTEQVLELSGVTMEQTEESSVSETETEEAGQEQAKEKAATAQAKTEEAEPEQTEEDAAKTEAEEAEQVQEKEEDRSAIRHERLKFLYQQKEVIDVFAFEARLARLEEELRVARERIAELEGGGE